MPDRISQPRERTSFKPFHRLPSRGLLSGSGGEARDTRSRPAKLRALHSSAALAINVFDYWALHDPVPLQLALNLAAPVSGIQFEAAFRTGLGGTPPHVDVVVRTGGATGVAIESKFTEWLRVARRGTAPFANSYFPAGPGLWRARGLPACQMLAEAVQRGDFAPEHLDVAQLLKHALGLRAESAGKLRLLYLYFDLKGPEGVQHRREIEAVRAQADPELALECLTYQELFARIARAAGPAHAAYLGYLRNRYFPHAAG
jgi:hypothetical protein